MAARSELSLILNLRTRRDVDHRSRDNNAAIGAAVSGLSNRGVTCQYQCRVMRVMPIWIDDLGDAVARVTKARGVGKRAIPESWSHPPTDIGAASRAVRGPWS